MTESNSSLLTFYVTTSASHPRGSGYWEVIVTSREAAREATFEALGNKWAFMYGSLADVHELDRKRHCTIQGN